MTHRIDIEKARAQRDAAYQKIEQLENRQKILRSKEIDAERRARTRRLIEHGAMLESVFPELTNCSKEKVMVFLSGASRLNGMDELIAAVIANDETG